MIERNIKYCAACEEKFTAKYGFCPNCGASLTAWQTPLTPCSSSDETISGSHRTIKPQPTEEQIFVARLEVESAYQPTIIREKNVKQRYALLAGAMFVFTLLAAGAFIYSIFNKNFDLAAIDSEDIFAYVSQVEPIPLDPAEDLRKAKNKDGGGGGGDEDENPVQKGREATQTDNPLISPSKDYVQLTNPALKIRAATLGNKKVPLTNEPYGLSKGGLIPSDGEGCCDGQGNSRIGRGQGNDPGDGLGPGRKGGSGNDGGDPLGGDPTGDKREPPKVIQRVSEPLKITFKPRANYTDLARLNMVQGKVVLKVTFLASGEIGPIIPVSGLPSGLTERAIAAARAIKFEPAKINGRAVSVTKTIEYNFAIF